MSSSTINNQVAANKLPCNPFSNWPSSVNQNPEKTVVSDLPDELAIEFFKYLKIEEVKAVLDITKSVMRSNRYALYRNLLSTRSSLTGTELVKFQRILSLEGQALTAGQTLKPRPWANILADKDKPIVFSELQHLNLSDSADITDADLIKLTESCPKLTKLILPGAYPSKEVLNVLNANCPNAAIYPSAITEYEWAHPIEFMTKIRLLPQPVIAFISHKWEGMTFAEAPIVMPKINKIIRNINGCSVMVSWNDDNFIELNRATNTGNSRYIYFYEFIGNEIHYTEFKYTRTEQIVIQ